MSSQYVDSKVRHETLTVNGRVLERGTEFTATGLGRMSFIAYVVNGEHEWVDAWDGQRFRSVLPEKITTVHRTTKLRKD